MSRTVALTAVCGLTLAGLLGYVVHLVTGQMPDRILFEPFGLYSVFWYAVILLVAILIGFWVAVTQPAFDAERIKISPWRNLLRVSVAGWLGARLLDVLFVSPIAQAQGITAASDFFDNPILLINLAWGGLNVWGALLGGTLMLMWLCWRSGSPFLATLFKVFAGFLLGQSLLQWGHFLNQELYGRPYSGFGAISIEPIYTLDGEPTAVFPLFLFGVIWYLAGGLWLALDQRWHRTAAGMADGLTFGLIWFVVGRQMLELATQYSRFNWLPMVVTLVVAIAIQLNSVAKTK